MINRKYKDSLFRLVFHDKKELLQLYNALNDSNYTDEALLTVTTLEDAVYINVKNDLSFMISATLNLYEHQSTYNPNMPLRGLLYLAKLYQQYIEATGANIYGSRKIELPTPRYLVFCNYQDMKEDYIKLKLSDSFLSKDAIPYALECVTEFINVNAGYNNELMAKCRKLYEYSLFIELMRELPNKCTNVDELTEQINKLMKDCISQNILADILQKHYSEVNDLIFEEFDMEKYIECEKQYVREDTLIACKIEDILDFLAELGTISENLRTTISSQTDLSTLKSWIKLAAKVSSIQEFEEAIK